MDKDFALCFMVSIDGYIVPVHGFNGWLYCTCTWLHGFMDGYIVPVTGVILSMDGYIVHVHGFNGWLYCTCTWCHGLH